MSNTDILRGGYEAFARGDVPAVMALFHPDISFRVPASIPTLGGRYEGPDEVLQFFGRLAQAFPELSITPERYVEQGDTVIVIGSDKGRSAGGATYETTFVHVWEMRDGKAADFLEVNDTAVIAATMGVPAQAGAEQVKAPIGD